MRIPVAVLALALLAAPASHAQDSFDPYFAIQDGMTLEEAEPLIEKHVGPIKERRYLGKFFLEPVEEGESSPLLMLMVPIQEPVGESRTDNLFLFCNGKMIATETSIPRDRAAWLYGVAVTEDELKPQDLLPVYSGDSLVLPSRDPELTIYLTLDEARGRYETSMMYPVSVFQAMDLTRHCPTE